jgi:predicted permease
VFSPNWVVDTSAQMQRLREFFVNTSPTWYFMPLTALATLLVWSLWASNRRDIVRRDYRRAAFFAVLATCVNAVTVAVVMKLFAPEYMTRAAALSRYCQYWNALNLVRMLLVAATAVFLFNAFRKLDRAGGERGRTALP